MILRSHEPSAVTIASRSLGPLSAGGSKAAPNSAGSLPNVADHRRANMLPPEKEPQPHRLRPLAVHLRNRRVWQPHVGKPHAIGYDKLSTDTAPGNSLPWEWTIVTKAEGEAGQMREAARGWHHVRKPVLVTVVIGAVGALAVALTSGRLGIQSSKGVMTVDFGDVVAPEEGAETDAADRRPTLRFAAGAMASPQTTRQQYGELLRVIADRVQRRALLAQRKTYAEINEMVERREVDVAFVCSAPYVVGRAKFSMETFIVPVTHGQKVYHSYILTHRDSPLNSFDALKGKLFAFTDPHSNTGCLVPKYMLAQRGETPQSFFAEFYYAYSHDNAIRAVAEGMADGAAVDSLI